MTDLPFDFSETLEAFECPEQITVYEKTGSYVDGYWTQIKENERQLSCILLNVDEKKLEIIAEGRHVDAAYSIMFDGEQDELFVMHQQDNFIQAKQSYALIDGFEYVVTNNPETNKNAGFKSYYAIRYKSSEDESEES
jgi:hypothetical protein